MKDRFIILLMIAIAFAGCKQEPNPEVKNESEAVEEQVVEKPQQPLRDYAESYSANDSLDWNGMYTGVVPCPEGPDEGCKGMRYSITLNSNNTYKLTSYILDNPAERTDEEGKVLWSEDGAYVKLTSPESSHHFMVQRGSIVMLNNDGALIHEDKYRLTKI